MQQDLKNCIEHLKNGGLILYPTDTLWGIGCDANNSEAIKKVYALKKRIDSKSLICLVADERMLSKYIKLQNFKVNTSDSNIKKKIKGYLGRE